MRPTLAYVGEREPELILPLRVAREVLPPHTLPTVQAGQIPMAAALYGVIPQLWTAPPYPREQPVIINIYVDGEQIARVLVRNPRVRGAIQHISRGAIVEAVGAPPLAGI
jgi:hypothetical protein